MKTRNLFLSTLFILFTGFSSAQADIQHFETTTFKVYGNCTMCKKTIETALKKNTSIKSADWNVETKMITVVYDPHSIGIDDIHKIIADAGYDTEKVKASDVAYKKLPGCCQYERKK